LRPVIKTADVAVIDDERIHLTVREVIDADSPLVTPDSSAQRRDGVSRRCPTNFKPKQILEG